MAHPEHLDHPEDSTKFILPTINAQLLAPIGWHLKITTEEGQGSPDPSIRHYFALTPDKRGLNTENRVGFTLQANPKASPVEKNLALSHAFISNAPFQIPLTAVIQIPTQDNFVIRRRKFESRTGITRSGNRILPETYIVETRVNKKTNSLYIATVGASTNAWPQFEPLAERLLGNIQLDQEV